MPGIMIGTKVRDARFPNKVGILSSKGDKFWVVVNEETKEQYMAPGKFWRRYRARYPELKQYALNKKHERRNAAVENSPYREIPADQIARVIELARANGVSVSFAWSALCEE